MRAATLVHSALALGVTLGVASFVGASPATAYHAYPYCVESTAFSGRDCSYTTLAQCKESASGRGTCIRDYSVPDPAEAVFVSPRPRRGHAHHKKHRHAY